MDKQHVLRKIAVMQAFANGHSVEYRPHPKTATSDDAWLDVPNPSWDWSSGEYRVRRRTFFLFNGRVYSTRTQAEMASVQRVTADHEIIEVREVLPAEGEGA